MGLVADICQDENIRSIVFMGDLINSQAESLPKVVYNAAYFVVSTLAKIKPLYLLVGNHDIYRLMHILDSFESIPNVYIVSKTVSKNIDGVQIDMVPWEQQLPKRRGDICLAHCEVKGSNMGGTVSKTGFDPGEFEGYDRVYLGHFHTRQHFNVPGCKEAMYIGSIMQHNYSDTNESKGVSIITSGPGLCNLAPIISPNFLKSEVSTKTALYNFNNMVDSSTDYYRLIVRNSKLELPKYSHRVQVEWDVKESANARMDVKAEESVKDIVYRFIETHKTELDKKNIRETLDSLMLGVW